MNGRFISWCRWVWREVAASWQDAQDCGDWAGHAFALAGVLLGVVVEDTAEWRPRV